MNYTNVNDKDKTNWFYKSSIKKIDFEIEDLYFENYAEWVYKQIDPKKNYIAIGIDQGNHFAKFFCNTYPKLCIAMYVLTDRNLTKKSYEKAFYSDTNYDYIKSIVGENYENYIIKNLTNKTIHDLLDKIKKTQNDKYVQLLNGLCKGIIRSQYDKIKYMKVKTIIYSDVNTLTPEKLEENKIFNENNNCTYYYIVDDDYYLIHGKYADEVYNNIYGLVKS